MADESTAKASQAASKPEIDKSATETKTQPTETETKSAADKETKPAAKTETQPAAKATKSSAKAAKSAAKTEGKAPSKKKAKEPEKTFAQVIEEDVIPSTINMFEERGVNDLRMTLNGTTLSGKFDSGKREFDIYFSDESLTSTKSITYTTDGIPASTVESFMIDERKAPAALVVLYIIQRMYAQQWL
ncbi:MAG: DUF2996 domain-containing protein [Cyanobacteria bacterium P01_D01_bin.123]